MSHTHRQYISQINGSPETIFDLIANMPNYRRWLPGSRAFAGITQVTPYPVRLGTTYLETGAIEKPGKVTEFDRPRHIGFQHTVQIRSPIHTDVEARIRYTLEPSQGGTAVLRELDITYELRGLLKLLNPVLLAGFRKENLRTLACLKRYVEGQPRK